MDRNFGEGASRNIALYVEQLAYVKAIMTKRIQANFVAAESAQKKVHV